MKTQIALAGPNPAIYNLHILGICLTLMTACSFFKEKSFFLADSLQKQKIRREIRSQTSSEVSGLRVYHRVDSSDKYSFTEIFPVGFFKYSVEDGFSGNAHKVLINGQIKQIKRIQDSAQLKQTKHSVSEIGETAGLSVKTRLKQKADHSSNYIWNLAALLLILAAVFWCRRRLNV